MDQIRDLLLYKEKMMKEYVVEITEVLQHQETVKAHSKNEAINVVREKYKNEDVILNDENITDLRFDVLEVKKKLFEQARTFVPKVSLLGTIPKTLQEME